MSERLSGTALLRRVLADHRRPSIILGVLLVLNLLVYALLVYPLGQRVANVEQRERAAERALVDARREHDAATGALTGKERASVELAAFYEEVLPPDLSGARRQTYLRLAQLAREAGLRLRNFTWGLDEDRRQNSTLERVRIRINLEGSYDAVRAFIYQLDTAPEFVVIDDVRLREGSSERSGILDLAVQLSTYFRVAGR